jgi:hypothetical protein
LFAHIRIFAQNKNDKLMTNHEDLLVKILQISHEQVMAGKSYSQKEAKRYLDEQLYEKTKHFQNKHTQTHRI